MFFQVRLVDASFVWTEPHSKREKVKLTIQKEVMNGAVLQQSFVVEFVVINQVIVKDILKNRFRNEVV